LYGFVKGQMEQDVYASLKSDAVVGGIHDRVKRHDARTEELFKYVQVFTAIVDSFSHGANDVANAMGPFIAVYMTWKNGEVAKKTEVGDDIYWILAIGGAGIAVGLSTYGYKIMNAIGVKLTAITPSRGFCIELGAAFVVIYGTGQGWPLSTTHCQVGATVGVGLFEGAQGINGWVLGKTVVGWVITLVVVGLSAAILVGPSPEPDYDLFCSTGEGLDAR
jgi:sodium-dependent phosphate transporter